MASNQENGHAKNVANFAALLTYLEGFGAAYAPTKPTLVLPQLQQLLAQARAAVSNVIDKKTNHDTKINERQIAFSNLKKISTRVLAVLQSTDADPRLIEDAKGYHRKINGKRANTKVNTMPIAAAQEPTSTTPQNIDGNNTPNTTNTTTGEETNTPSQNSVSQQSYVLLVQHLEGFISVVRTEPTYAPSQAELQVPNLIAYKNDLETKTFDLNRAEIEVNLARINRKKILYTNTHSLVEVAADIKNFVKGDLGNESEEFKMIKGIMFKYIP